jgi:hypothetical protein
MNAKLVNAGVALLVLSVMHGLDHALNQHRGGFGVIGGLGIVASAVVVVLAIRGSDLAAPALAVVGFSSAIGFLVIHVAPHWGPVSDPYYDTDAVNAISWFVLAICIGVSFYAGTVGLQAQRESRAESLSA